MRRWPRRGGSTGSSRGGPRVVPVLHRPASWSARSPTWSGCTWTRRRTRSCCAWTRSRQIQALDRTAPILPLQPGLAERRSHDYVRHGTSTLFAALEIATGTGHRGLQAPAPAPGVPGLPQAGRPRLPRPATLHLVMDNYAAHKHPAVKAWLAANPRVIVHFTPTHASWMNLVEVWFSIIERQAIHRGTSAPSTTSTPRSAPSSTAGTTAATPSSGPRPPTRSSRKPTVRRPQTRGTSCSVLGMNW